MASKLPMLGQRAGVDRIARVSGAKRYAGFRSMDLSMDALKQPQVPLQSALARPFLPQESPLSMLPCRLDRAADVRRSQTLTSAGLLVRRLFIFTGTALLTLAGGYSMYDVVKVGGVTFL